MLGIPLEIPLGLFPLGRRRQCHDPANPGVEAFRDPLDATTLAGSIPAFKDYYDFKIVMTDPFLNLPSYMLNW